MAGGILFWAFGGWWAATLLVQGVSAGLARSRRAIGRRRHGPADFSIVAPVAGGRDASGAYIGTLAALARRGAEILVCVTGEDDPALRQVRALWPEATVLVGSDDTFNPKLNNVRKGLEAATRPVVALCDAGIALTEDDLAAAAGELSDEVGLVLALKVGDGPENFAGEMECAYINGHQARFLLAADRLGMPVASGGVTILTRGLWKDVWRRQVRWGSTRLNLAPEVRALVLFEPAIGWLASTIALIGAWLAAGAASVYLPLAVAVQTGAWFALEGWFLAGCGLPFGPRGWAAALVRETLVPVLAAKAWLGRNSIDWRGTNLAAGWRPGRDGAAEKHV